MAILPKHTSGYLSTPDGARISRPTWVVGGEDDRVLPAEIQREMAALVPNSRLTLFLGYGHGNDQENPAYEVELLRFIKACERGDAP